MLLALRTDSVMAELALLNPDGIAVVSDRWEADRRLSSELLDHIERLLQQAGSSWEELRGVIVFRGPGSFTGLRIGITVGNTIAYAQDLPLVGTLGEGWLEQGVDRLKYQDSDELVLPEYGAAAAITRPARTSLDGTPAKEVK